MTLMPFRKLVAAGALGCLTCASIATFVGCSDDDDGGAATQDAGPTGDSGPTTDDGGPTNNSCADAGPPARTCTAKACTEQAGGEPSVCVEGQCVRLKSEECPFVAGAIDDDNAIIIGSLSDLNGVDKASGGFRQNTVELAVTEINAAGGVPTKDGCGSRPLAYVSCDDTKAFSADGGFDVPSRRRAARHLAEELKAVGVIGGFGSNTSIEIATNITNPAKTLLIAPTAGAAEYTTIANATQDGVRMAWRMVPSDALQGKAVATYGARVAADLNKTPLKVAIVNRNDPFGNGLRDGVKANFQPNGKPWDDASNAGSVLEVVYPASGATAQQYTDAVDALAAFEPDLIFWFGLGEITGNIIVPFEKRNPATKPMWISATSGQRNEIIANLGSDDEFRATGFQARVRGTSAQLTTSLSQDFFNFRYKSKFQDPKTLIFGQTQVYDATYLIAFAATATQPMYDPIASIDVARGLAKTVGGTEVINVGPNRLKAGLESLRTGKAIDFNGASGPLDFDVTKGEADGDYAIWCVRTDPNTNLPVFENVTGMTWRFASNSLEGTFTCPQ